MFNTEQACYLRVIALSVKTSKALLTQTGMHNSGAPSYASDP